MNPHPQAARAGAEAAALARQNRILLTVCIVAIVLLGPMFTAGYLVGRGTAATVPPAQVSLTPPKNADAKHRAPSRPAASTATIPNQGALRGTYLQLTASPQYQAVIRRLRENGFDTVALEIPEKPGVYRVLVGPLQETTLAQTRTQLEQMGLPGEAAIPRVF